MNAITYTRTSSTSKKDRLKIAKKLAEMIKIDTDKVTERDKKDYWILTRPKKAEKASQMRIGKKLRTAS